MDALDVALLVLVALAALRGLRLGAATQLLQFLGLVAGLALGVTLILLVDPHVRGPVPKTAVAIGLLLVPSTLASGLGRRLGGRARRALRRARIGRLDSAAGAVVAAGEALVVCWLAASVLVNTAFVGIAGQIESSVVLRDVGQALPPVPNAFAAVERYLRSDGFPVVLANVVPEPVGPVHLASASELRRAAAAARSTVKVVAIGCGVEQEGSGFVAALGRRDDLVVTNAHVVAGTTSITVEAPDGAASLAVPVLFDPRFDLAVLRTAPLGEPVLRVDPGLLERGAPAVVLGYPEGGPLSERPAGVLARFEAEGRDIYDTALSVRTVYALRAVVRPGNSGGPLVTPGGEVIGVVFSRSASNRDLGYALASPGVLSRLDRAERHPGRPGTGACVS